MSAKFSSVTCTASTNSGFRTYLVVRLVFSKIVLFVAVSNCAKIIPKSNTDQNYNGSDDDDEIDHAWSSSLYFLSRGSSSMVT